MKLRLLRVKNNLYIYCTNGSILKAEAEDLARLLKGFSRPQQFKGSSGYWNVEMASMEEAAGVTLAYVDDTNKLVVLSEEAFSGIVSTQEKYVSVSEYAALHGKCRATIKNLCVAGRLPGAYKTSSGWSIPKDAPYPTDGRFKNAKKT